MKNNERSVARKRSIKAKNIAMDAIIPLIAYTISKFFFSAEQSLLIAICASTISLLIEANWDIAFQKWFIAIVSVALFINLSAIFLIELPGRIKAPLALAPVFIAEFAILYWIVEAFKRRSASGG